MLPRLSLGADLAVHRARVTGWRASRGEAERWLEGVRIASLGLDPDEILYVPRLRVRAPASGIGAARMSDRILAELRTVLGEAETGWGRGFVPDRPYRFTSRGKYSAWLIRLWIGESSTAAREAFRRATAQESLVEWQRATLLRHGPALVATIARLAEIGMAARWVASFEPADIALAYRAIEASFALRLAVPTRTARDAQPLDSVGPRTIPVTAPVAVLPEAATWLVEHRNEWRVLPEPARALLLATAALARKPAIASRDPQAVATAILAVAAEPALLTPERRVDAATPPPAGARAQPRRNVAPTLRPKPGQVPSMDLRHAASPRPDMGVSPLPGASKHIAASPSDAVVQHFLPQTEIAAEARHHIRQPALPATLLAPDVRFSTEFGGLLFLVNAFVALGLYPDFTQPKGKRLEPSPLWLADRIGRYWFGTRYRRDPLANWIAAHAENGRLPRNWRIERDWLAGFETSAPRRLTRRRRHTTLWHPAGFPLADGRERDLQPRERRARPASGAPARLPLIERWPACLALYLNARLEHLTGTGLALLAQPARIETRDLDLQAVFGLDRHPIELRLAGLDRNPGWQPAEGRSIAFAFE